jgi:hypothetical protein
MNQRKRAHKTHPLAFLVATAAVLAGCGGGDSPGLPPPVANPPGLTGGKLSFAYFQRCVNPVLNTPLRIVINGVPSVSTCAAAGCHDNTSGTGGALRLLGAAPAVDLALAPGTLRASDMYKNYYSALGEAVVGNPVQSRLLNKPLVRDVLHGGGLVFESAEDPGARVLRYWIQRPMPQGQDEFSIAANTMFTPPDPATGACNSD